VVHRFAAVFAVGQAAGEVFADQVPELVVAHLAPRVPEHAEVLPQGKAPGSQKELQTR
jgi:hypothetical protein